MGRRPPPEWELQFPAVRCPHCKQPIRGRFRGRFQFRALKGRGWRLQTGEVLAVPKMAESADVPFAVILTEKDPVPKEVPDATVPPQA